MLEGANGAISAIWGKSQVDFVAAGIDKATGLRALQRELSSGDRSPAVALAVGDTSADAGMLALAQRSRAPAHAREAALGPGVKRLPKPYQRGLALAVGELVGHPPGACSAATGLASAGKRKP